LNPHSSSYKNQSQSHSNQRFSGRTTSANLYSLNQVSDQSSEEEEEEIDELERRSLKDIKLGIPTLSMQPISTPSRNNNLINKSLGGSGGRRKSNGGSGGSGKKNGRNGERKASVRKQDYELEGVIGELDDEEDEEEGDEESDLTDVPSADGKGEKKDQEGSDSDSDMEAKLKAAGDGESLLGSANSDQDPEEEEEEEQYLIEDTLMREAKARARAQQNGRGGGPSSRGRGSGHGRSFKKGNSTQRSSESNMDEDDQDADEEEGNDEADDEEEGDAAQAASMSPDTMRLLGLPVLDEDELFEEQDGFHSSSEPSFTDFFGSSDEGDSNARDDDDESTDDDLRNSDDEISDLDGGILGAPFLAHFTSTQDGADLINGGELIAAGENNELASSLLQQPDVPLLVIEDLDGRLIYARAGDGEAVFGSDGEFEFVDDSDEDDSDEDMTFNGRLGGLDEDTWRELGLGPSDIGDDSGETTDELPDEDMPFPRLLVGSVAPHGGRAARRARAMAAKNTPRGRQRSREHSNSVGSSQPNPAAASKEAPTTSTDVSDPDAIITEASATQDPVQAQKPAKSSTNGEEFAAESSGAKPAQPTTPEAKETTLPALPSSAAPEYPKPEMGSFMPASAKSVHRAVLDGSRKAPSPFASRLALQSRGLSRKRNQRRVSICVSVSIPY